MSKTMITITSMLAIAWTGTAYAQTSSAEPSDAASTQPNDAGVEEIVVTAQRRSQRLVDVPVSVATASAADLERAGATSIENLTKVTPGVYLQRAIYGLSPTVRGIGSTLAASGGEQNVALYVDEIYYPTPTGNITDLASIAGVEVLKGPQGTLFGRNATGGAILMRTLDPGFTPEGRFNLSYERFNQIRTSAYLNVPLSDTVAVNGAVAYRYSGGYVRDLLSDRITNSGRNFTARMKLLFEPTDNFSLILTASHADFDDPSGSDTRALKPSPLIQILSGGLVAKDRYHSSFNTRQVIRTRTDEYSARAKLELDGGTLSSFTSFLNNKLDAVNELDLSYIDATVSLGTRVKTFSQEVNFASPTGNALSYIAGIYYFRSRAEVPYVTSGLLTPPVPLSNSEGDSDAIAGYADGTYKIGDLSLIAGMRYSYEKRRTRSAFGTSAPSPFTRFQEVADKQWTPRIGLRYALTEKANVYATYSKGFKSGTFDATTPTGPGVKPETVDAFEAGLKMALPGISFNTAAYYYDYKNTQMNATVSGDNGAVFSQLFNVPKSRIYGAEADLTITLNDNFDLRAAVAYTHARYVDFKFAPGYVDVGALTFANVSLDVSGNTMVRAPEFTASGTLSYHMSVGNDKRFEVNISPYYSSRVYFTFDNSLSQKAYATVDASAALTLHDKIKLSIFGRNLTDSKHLISASQNTLILSAVRYAEPRVYGVSFGYSF